MVSAPLPRPFLPGSLPGSQPAARLEREPEPEFGRAAATPRRRLKVGQLSLFRAGTTVPLTRVSLGTGTGTGTYQLHRQRKQTKK